MSSLKLNFQASLPKQVVHWYVLQDIVNMLAISVWEWLSSMLIREKWLWSINFKLKKMLFVVLLDPKSNYSTKEEIWMASFKTTTFKVWRHFRAWYLLTNSGNDWLIIPSKISRFCLQIKSNDNKQPLDATLTLWSALQGSLIRSRVRVYSLNCWLTVSVCFWSLLYFDILQN